MKGLLQPLLGTPELKSLCGGLDRGYDQQIVFGLSGSALSYVIGGLVSACRCTVLVVTPGDAECISMAEELGLLLSGTKVYPFPAWPLLPGHVLARDQEIPAQRLRALGALAEAGEKVVVAPVEALLRRLSSPQMFFSARVSLRTGDRVDLQELRRALSEYGYEWVELVELKGQFSIRGGILDIFPVTFDQPVRVEFFDDEVDSIRFFNQETQRSEKKVEVVDFGPASELIVNDEVRMRALEMLKAEQSGIYREVSKTRLSAAKAQQAELARMFADQLASGGFSPQWEQYLPYFYARPYTLFDYLPPQSVVLVVDFLRAKEIVESVQKERTQTFTDLLAAGKILPGQFNIYVDWNRITEGLARKKAVYFSLLPRHPKELTPKNTVVFSARGLQTFLGRFEMLANEVRQHKKNGYAVVFLVNTEERARQLQEFLRDARVDAFFAPSLTGEIVRPGNVVISLGRLGNGFELISARLVVFTEGEIYGEIRAARRERYRKVKQAAPFADLREGDYVVHVNHGIGRYQGVVSLSIGGVSKDYLLIQYAGEDKLYVPTDQIGLIQKYLGAEGVAPRLSRLGGNEWSRLKSRVKEAVREMADELLALYAARQKLPGHAFAPDTVWQKEFEENFPFEETPDQLRAIAEVKADMERPRPMDRLLCGDVGYGKTEVALRAAFKAVVEGKQVAVLVPTTVLAQQHYNTFRERFAGFPVTVEMLSRFRSPKEQRQIVNAIKEGKVDIVIGTHRLVQEDVVFKDLGLVVVDEEQRFGVAHKERLKQLRQDVDVLTLTATPIPRTLHMSLVGVRDTSLLETPPENRFPVQTYVLEEDPVLIREAIRRELGRGGQVFFVYNRVQDLDRVAAWLKGLVPEARIAIAHGQMKEDDLEQVMMDFVEGLFDILVCTTIIENGLDIPNVNTLIVKDAQNLGLAQLYQLRGRVGRSSRLAYAYFTFRRDQVLSELAEKRLAAIREFTEFGSGYKIAMRDLEIRGAGNLLGPEQHGHIAAVGFDLYCRLLAEAVQEAKGEPVRRLPETTVEVPVEAFIPESYIRDPNQKVDVYRRLAAVRKEEEVADLEEELTDRFGDPPAPVQTLLVVAQVRAMASQLGIKSIVGQEGGFRLQFFPDHGLRGEVLVAVSKKYYNRIKFSNAGDFEIRLKTRIPPGEPLNYLGFVKDFLSLLKEEGALEKESGVGS